MDRQPYQNSLSAGDGHLGIAHACQVNNALSTCAHTPGLGCRCLTSPNAVQIEGLLYESTRPGVSPHVK
jgi:hypothetical protein